MKNFRLTDQEYQKFVAWVSEQKFTYATELDEKADELIASAKREKYYDELQSQFTELKTRIEQNKSSALSRKKPELTRILEQEKPFDWMSCSALPVPPETTS